jgi:chromosome partitioning protein
MPVILIGGEKGGTGKSTIATNLSIMSCLMGHDVLLLDTDKQGSSSKFIGHRNEAGLKPTPTCVQIRGKYLHKEIEDLNQRYEVIVIDAGGQDSIELRSAMASPSVTKLYTPLQPSEFDLNTLATMDDLVCTAQSFNHNLEAFLIFNQSPTHSKIYSLEEAKEFCKEYENIKICSSIVSHRVPFQYATSHYMSVVEFELDRIKSMPAWRAKRYSPKASMELCDLYEEIFSEKFTSEITESFNLLAVPEGEVA